MKSLAEQTRWVDAMGQAELVCVGQVAASELVDAAIERIETLDDVLNAVVLRWFDEARGTAEWVRGDGVLAGVPFLLKDLVAAYRGQPLCNGNRRLKELAVPSVADSTVVARLRAAGLVTLGRTNTPEFGAMGATVSTAWGVTRNPWDPSRSPGGSSGGSAAAVAAGMVPVAHASDGAGSIRLPAAWCGLVGLKPSQGRSTAGPDGDESGGAVQGCLSRSVRDTAVMLDVIAGPGVGDSVQAPTPLRPYATEVGVDPGSLRIGILDHLPTGVPVDDDCAAAVCQTGQLLESLGHRVEPGFPAALSDPAWDEQMWALRAVGVAATLARLGEVLGRDVGPDDVEPVVWARAQFAPSFTAVDYARALAAQARYRRAVQRWWVDGWDLLLTPTVDRPPEPIDETAPQTLDDSAGRARAGMTTFTRPFNTTGQPAISLPLHWTADNLPVGIQLVGAYGAEDVLIRVASQLEQAQPWTTRHPDTYGAGHAPS